ncbi:hypothetical protein E2562_032191 [Oryza meyeriana var. granulata]|uniref:DUF834 domain-containing protein n=1 Tax=Oryza meyeriana var. granulata TaxID=110450 RepID=A0A6G1F0F1_9ORYZ|nr:hypothetical protein E2562_032191 [Oryza meyeriana var. granulata]
MEAENAKIFMRPAVPLLLLMLEVAFDDAGSGGVRVDVAWAGREGRHRDDERSERCKRAAVMDEFRNADSNLGEGKMWAWSSGQEEETA